MPSDSVAAFLEQARELRLMADADLARLADSPDANTDLPDFTRQLVATGLLTPFQADRILTGRAYTLGFAGFPLLDECDDHTYRAVEPSSRSEVRLSHFSGESPSPARTPHPALSAPIVVGTYGGEGYAVHRKPDGTHLAALVSDMGPMPSLLAAEYTRQAAAALAAAHAAGTVHAHLCLQRLFVGPLVQANKPKADGSPRFRPGPTATVSITDFGLPAADRTAADDVFALGGVLFHLLTGRDPGGASLSASRPDCPPELVTVVKGMLALAPADRPTMAEVVCELTAIITPGQTDAVPLGKDSSPGVPPANAKPRCATAFRPRSASATRWRWPTVASARCSPSERRHWKTPSAAMANSIPSLGNSSSNGAGRRRPRPWPTPSR